MQVNQYTLKNLQKMVDDGRFQLPQLPNNKEFKNCKVLGNKVLSIADVNVDLIDGNPQRVNDNLTDRYPGLSHSFGVSIRYDKLPPAVYELKSHPGVYYLCDGFGRVYMFKTDGQLHWVFTVIQVPDESFVENIQSWYNEHTPSVCNTEDDYVNLVLRRISKGLLKSHEKGIRSYLKNVHVHQPKPVRDTVVSQVLQKLDVGYKPDHWYTLDSKTFDNFNEWLVKVSSVPVFNNLNTRYSPKKYIETTNGNFLAFARQGMVYSRLQDSIMNYYSKNHGKKKVIGVPFDFIFHTNNRIKNYEGLTKVRIGMIKDLIDFLKVNYGSYSWKRARKSFNILGFFPQAWNGQNGESRKELVSIDKVVNQAHKLGINVPFTWRTLKKYQLV